jgi:ParB-like chromosome segregation protein Spo0J
MTDLRNPLPALDSATDAARRSSIAHFGVLVPVLVDQNGELVDGHHRQAIATELGIDCPVHVVELPDGTEERARAIIEINDARRQRLSPDERRTVVLALREQGHSQRAIAAAVGVSKKTVQNDIAAQVDRGIHLPAIPDGNGDRAQSTTPTSDAVVGLDGRRYRAAATRRKRRSKVHRLPASPSWARLVTSELRKLRWGIDEARTWADRHTLPPETLERLADTREQAAGLLRDIDELLGRDTPWGTQPRQGELLAAAYLRRAVELFAKTSDAPRLQLQDCRGHLDALDTQLRRLLDEDDA